MAPSCFGKEGHADRCLLDVGTGNGVAVVAVPAVELLNRVGQDPKSKSSSSPYKSAMAPICLIPTLMISLVAAASASYHRSLSSRCSLQVAAEARAARKAAVEIPASMASKAFQKYAPASCSLNLHRCIHLTAASISASVGVV